MIPKLEFATENNRMNPPGKAFLYAGIQNNKPGIIRTCLKEIRSPVNSIATICEFQVTDSGKHKKVINICGDNNIPQDVDKLGQYMMENAIGKSMLDLDRQKLSIILANIYFNIFSSNQIFKPVDSTILQDEKRYEYAPFHALAHYISDAGYAGIIFNSTVYLNGKNLVIFEPNEDVSVVPNTMEHVIASDYI